ncbi:hypothetical protein ACIBCH_41815 [Amycolatopsis thailandensis]|uniref:hypothetical protein n=1 Tax=Amycolatopsis thailandensis TaxID=589330 RepID=UPI00378B0BF5
MTAAVRTPDLIADAVTALGYLTIVVEPVEDFEAVFDRHTHVLSIDPECVDIAAAIDDTIGTLVPASPKLTVIKGGAA